MGQDRLNNLMILACESDLTVDPDSVINVFAETSEYLAKALM